MTQIQNVLQSADPSFVPGIFIMFILIYLAFAGAAKADEKAGRHWEGAPSPASSAGTIVLVAVIFLIVAIAFGQ